MTARAILFAGPSLSGAILPPGIALRPPAVGGDLLRAVAERPCAIGLVDGLFETAPSVGHKEILAVMAAGVAVLGAASLGALRAAELAPFGMVGIGAIFAAYRDGRIDRDDAVMVAHAPAELDFRPLTVPLVDIHAVLDAAPLADPVRRRLRAVAGRINFRELSWQAVLAGFGDGAEAIRPILAAHAFSQKRRDAEALVAAIAEEPAGPPKLAPVPATGYLEGLRRRALSC